MTAHSILRLGTTESKDLFLQAKTKEGQSTMNSSPQSRSTEEDILHCLKSTARLRVNRLSIDMLKSLGKDDYVIATASMSFSLAMAKASSEKHKLEAENVKEEEIAAAMQYLLRLLEGKSDLTGNEVILFHNIWIKKEIKLTQNARRLLAIYYGCEARLITKNERKLKNKIRKLDVFRKFSKQFDAANFQKILNHEMFLTSGVHVSVTWREHFQRNLTRKCQFYVTDQEHVRVDLMTLKSGLVCVSDDVICATILELPLTAHKMSMLFYLPYEKNGLEFLENNLTVETFGEVLERVGSSKQRPVNVAIPRFSLVFNDVIPREVLETRSQSRELHSRHQSEIFHTVSVHVNEQGVNMAQEGATSEDTIIGPAVLDGIRWTTFTADHPFLFMLIEMNTKMIFICGKVSKPQWNEIENTSFCNKQKITWCCI